jgi:ATP-dependent Clp protease protease subunit
MAAGASPRLAGAGRARDRAGHETLEDAEVSDRPTPFRAEEPEEPEAPETQGTKPAEPPVNELESRLLKGRKVMIFGQIDDKLARDAVARILTLAEESDKPIQIFVNSQGGHVESGDSIHDIVKFVRGSVPVHMIGTGWVASAGALIYLGAERHLRVCLPNTRFLLHQPMGGVQGRATDIDIEAREIIKMRERLSQLIATETGQPIERVRKDTERNYWMSAPEAVDYGLADRIIRTAADLA